MFHKLVCVQALCVHCQDSTCMPGPFNLSGPVIIPEQQCQALIQPDPWVNPLQLLRLAFSPGM